MITGPGFFRKLTGDGRVKAVGTSLTAVLPDAITEGTLQNGRQALLPP